VVRVPVLPNVTWAPRMPMEVEIPRLPRFMRMPGKSAHYRPAFDLA